MSLSGFIGRGEQPRCSRCGQSRLKCACPDLSYISDAKLVEAFLFMYFPYNPTHAPCANETCKLCHEEKRVR